MKKTVIDVKNLWKVYTRGNIPFDIRDTQEIERLENEHLLVPAVRGVSLEARRGEVFIIMGLSGSGKSTLIRCLLRLIEPTSGVVRIAGENVTGLDKNALTAFRRQEVAMVFQHYGLLPHRTVLDNVSFGLKLRGEKKEERTEKARAALKRVGLEGWGKYYPSSLSGGMQQRVGIARALVMDAPVLFMDEPFSGLDPLIRREMQDELIRLQEEMHKTIFFVTHDLDEAIKLGDRMAVMKSGRFVQTGTPAEIMANPADEYVARFVQDKREQIELVSQDKTEKIAAYMSA